MSSRFSDVENLEMLPGETIEIHRPRGLAVGPGGKLLAISDGKVHVVDPKTGERQTLISSRHLRASRA